MYFSLALTVMGAFFGLCGICSAATGPEAQYIDAASGTDWPGFGRTYGEQHFSPLTQIDSRNVGRLGLAWSIDLPPGNAATEPVEVGGVLYYAQGLSIIHAVDAASGKELWRFDPHSGEQAGLGLRFSWGSHGLCWWNGKVYIGTEDGRLIALDGKTGKPVWSVQHAIKGGGQFIERRATRPRRQDHRRPGRRRLLLLTRLYHGLRCGDGQAVVALLHGAR